MSLKHPEAHAHYEAMLQGPQKQIHNIVYEGVDKDLVKKTAIKPKEDVAHLDLMLIIGAEFWFPINLAPVP